MAANTALGSDDASYDIYSTEMVDDKSATVALTKTTADGSIDALGVEIRGAAQTAGTSRELIRW